MSRNGFGLAICTIWDFVPTFESAPPGYVGRHRKPQRRRVVLSSFPTLSRTRLPDWAKLIPWRDIMAVTVTVSMTSGLMGLVLFVTHTYGG